MLRVFLRAYPKKFRERHGEELLRLCHEVYGDGFSVGAMGDLLWNGLMERLGRAPGSFGEWLERPVREGRGERLVGMVWNDARHAVRGFRANPGFACAVLLTLALGIGANTALFSVVDAVLLRPLPYANGPRLVHLLQPAQGAGVEDVGFSPLEVQDYRTQSRALDAVVEYHSMPFTLLGGAEAQRVQTGVVSAGFFDAFGVRALHGRTFVPADEEQGAMPVLVLSFEYWQRVYRGDPGIVGKSFTMNDRSHLVVGVLPPMPQYPGVNDVYMPTTACPFRNGAHWPHDRTARGLTVFGRLRPGASLQSAQADLAAVASRLRGEYPAAYPASEGYQTRAALLRDELTRHARPTLLALLATTAFLLVIVCANVANLTMARLVRREHEMAVRTALGATRARLVQQLLTENLILALAGGALGLLVARWGLDGLAALAERFTTRATEIRLDGRVLAFAAGMSLFTGLLLGCLPALPRRASLASDLKEGAGATAGHGPLRARSALIVAQVAISFALLTGAGLMLRSLFKLQQVAVGFDVGNVLTARVDLNWTRYREGEKSGAFADALLRKLREMPGALAVGIGGSVPLDGNSNPFGLNLRIEGRAEEGTAQPHAEIDTFTPGYFRAMGIPLLLGRDAGEADRPPAPQVALVNQSFARHWLGPDPIGKRLSADGGKTWVPVVGVVADIKQHGLEKEPADEIWSPLAFSPNRDMRVIVRSRAAPLSLERAVREAVRELDPDQPVTEVKTLEQVRADALSPPRLTAFLLGAFALLALGITAAGIGGVIAWSVGQRTQEIGIRMALGAEPSAVLRMILRQGMALIALGLALGLLGGLALSRVMAGLVFGIAARDPVTFLAGAAVLTAVGALACLVPARRAAEVDPMIALRSA
ncbi:MAG TPA: ABC transporter permease [Myxococcales bacterium]|nr:ABC transporter permease [Myxococcales bacterium]